MTAKVAVIGRVEWVTQARGQVPIAGQIVSLRDAFEEPAAGGAVTAAQMARLGAECRFYTAIGDDVFGPACVAILRRPPNNVRGVATAPEV